MKGIILAGGSGSRLYPLTLVTSKQLLPVYDKPMIYYPLTLLMDAGIREILIISTPADIGRFRDLFKDGSHLGIKLSYLVQEKPEGLAQAFILGEDFIDGEGCAMVLGDNIFTGEGLPEILKTAAGRDKGATIFAYKVKDPERFGVVEFNDDMKAVSIEEKPKEPRSSYAVTGLYFYDENVCKMAKTLTPSKRGELEITDLNLLYLNKGQLNVELLNDEHTWMDAGTQESLINATNFIYEEEIKLGRKIGCPEEAALRNKWITGEDVLKLCMNYNNEYGEYLRKTAGEDMA